MKQVSTEKYIEQLGCEVYPITIVKFLLNKRRILSYFSKAADKNFELRVKYTLDHSNCEACEEKKSDGVLCRQHTSIDRVMTGKKVAYDLDTSTYFYKNEIFRMVGSKLVIVYCPHPKLISGDITDAKTRKVTPITIEDPELTKLPDYEELSDFISSELMEQYMRCWFNHEFSLLTIPADRNSQNWCLLPNN